jgi:GNAT superfamily N-acetyltransferase
VFKLSTCSPLAAVQVGFATTCEFYAWPDRCRLRLAQLLVLPPQQRRGIGAALLEAVHLTAQQRGALDVVVRRSAFRAQEGAVFRCSCVVPKLGDGQARKQVTR